MPILAVVGITETGERDVLAFRVGDRENEQAWKDLLDDLKERGVKTIDLWVSDGNQAMLNAITKKFPDSARQRCVVHKMDNVLSYVPTKQQEQLKPELKALFYQKDRQAADQAVAAFVEKYRSVYPTAMECLQRDLEACLTFYAYPKEHWKTIRTNNILERLFGEVKRRSHKMAAAFRNEGSCLLMFYAVIRGLTAGRGIPAAAAPLPARSALFQATSTGRSPPSVSRCTSRCSRARYRSCGRGLRKRWCRTSFRRPR